MLIAQRTFRRLFGVQSGVRAQLHVCERCDGDFVEATRWFPVVSGKRRVALRCADCGHARETIADLTASALLKAAEAHRHERMAETADRLAEERMTAWIESFAVALERDLIDATHF